MPIRCENCVHFIRHDPIRIPHSNLYTPCRLEVFIPVDPDDFGCALGRDKNETSYDPSFVECVLAARAYKDLLMGQLKNVISMYDKLNDDGKRIASDVETVMNALEPIFETLDQATDEIN